MRTLTKLQNMLVDGTHPTEAGYQEMGSIWYNAIAAIPSGWVKAPIGPDPNHPLNCGGNNELSPITGGASSNGARGDLSANGGPDPNIPAPVFHNGKLACEIALGLGHPGDWKYHEAWVSGGQIVSGLHLDMAGVQLYDMVSILKAVRVTFRPTHPFHTLRGTTLPPNEKCANVFTLCFPGWRRE